MLKRLIILLDDTSTSYCHYENMRTRSVLLPIESLKDAIHLAQIKNLSIQFVFPNFELEDDYKALINSVVHSSIVSSLCEDEKLLNSADIVVLNEWTSIEYLEFKKNKVYILRTTKNDFFDRYRFLPIVLKKLSNIKIVFTDVDTFSDDDLNRYEETLFRLIEPIKNIFLSGIAVEFNALTDCFILPKSENSNSNDTTITLAPEGNLYVCPAYYLECPTNVSISQIGSISNDMNSLHQLSTFYLCKEHDMFKCNRCVWLNHKLNSDMNTPSYFQHAIAQIEYKTSQELLKRISNHKVI